HTSPQPQHGDQVSEPDVSAEDADDVLRANDDRLRPRAGIEGVPAVQAGDRSETNRDLAQARVLPVDAGADGGLHGGGQGVDGGRFAIAGEGADERLHVEQTGATKQGLDVQEVTVEGGVGGVEMWVGGELRDYLAKLLSQSL